MDIIVDFDLTGESLRIPNFIPTLSNDGQRFDSFNVYYRVTATNLRDCNPPPSAGLNDSNGDGQSDGSEKNSGSDPNNSNDKYVDSDGDGMSDDYEKAKRFIELLEKN